MQKPPQLKVVSSAEAKLGRPTIMDRALAARYGAAYVRLAAFAIDIDRVHQLDQPGLPFAWEVYLTEVQLERLVNTSRHDPMPMLEDMCLAILELPRPKGTHLAPLGSQLPFAVYTAVGRGVLPNKLGQCFAGWKKPPVDLIADVTALANEHALSARLARLCLEAPITPQLAPPTREALDEIAQRANNQ